MREFWYLSGQVALRHWRIYRKSLFSNMIPTLTDPLFFIVTFGIGLGAYVNEVRGMSYLQFMAPGLAISTALFTAYFETSYNFFVRLNFEHIYTAMQTTPVGPREIIAGEMIWLACKGALMATGVTLVLACFGLASGPWILLIPVVGSLTALACGALGLIATGYVNNINQFQTVYALIISPLFYFSGIFFPLTQLPPWLQSLIQVSPLYHGVRIAQELFWQHDVLRTLLLHGSYLILSFFVLGWFAYKKIYPKLYH